MQVLNLLQILNHLLILHCKIIIVFLIVFSTLSIALETLTLSSGFGENLNYWYWNFDNEAKNWGMTCKGEIIFIRLENLKFLKYYLINYFHLIFVLLIFNS